MGYRANLVTQHREYGRNVFYNWQDFQDWLTFVRSEYEGDLADSIYESESEDYYEIPREIFEKEIERLGKLGESDKGTATGMDVQDSIENFEGALKEAVAGDDFVALEWY